MYNYSKVSVNCVVFISTGIAKVEHEKYKGASYIDTLVQDCSISSALALEILQSRTKPSRFTKYILDI